MSGVGSGAARHQLKPGDEVVLFGLSAESYNGRVGTLEEWMPGPKRWAVTVHADSRGVAENGLLLKPKNLMAHATYFDGSSEGEGEEGGGGGGGGGGGDDATQEVTRLDGVKSAGTSPHEIQLKDTTQALMTQVSDSSVRTPSTSAGSSPSRSVSGAKRGDRRASSLDPDKQALVDDMRAVEHGAAPVRSASGRRRVNSLGRSLHRPNPASTAAEATATVEGSSGDQAVVAFADARHNRATLVSESTRKRLEDFYNANKETRFPKNVRRAPGSAPHLSYEEAMEWAASCHPRVIDTTVKKGNRRHSFCRDAFGWHLCRCRQNKCTDPDEKARLDFLQQSTFDRYGIGIALYFKYLKLLVVTYTVLFFFVGAPSALMYFFYDDELGRIVATSDDGVAESVISAMNLAFNQLTIGNLGSNDQFCRVGDMDSNSTTSFNSGTTTLPATSIAASSTEENLELSCPSGSTIAISKAFYGIFSGTCDCPEEQTPDNGVCPGELQYELDSGGNLQQLCLGYCYPGTLNTVGASCCSHSLLAGSTSDANFTELAVEYTTGECRANSRALYALLATECDGFLNCSLSRSSSTRYNLTDTQVVYFQNDDGSVLYSDDSEGVLSVSLADIVGSCTQSELLNTRMLVTFQCVADSNLWDRGWEFISKDQVRLLVSLLDFLGCVYFLFQVFLLKSQEDAAVYQLRTKNLTADDYTIMLTNLPKHNSLWQLDRHLREHFDSHLNDEHIAESFGLHWNTQLRTRVADINFGVEKSAEMITLLKERGMWVQRLYTINAKMTQRHAAAAKLGGERKHLDVAPSATDDALLEGAAASKEEKDTPTVGLIGPGLAIKEATKNRTRKAREECKARIRGIDAQLRALEGPGGCAVRATVAFVTFCSEEGALRAHQLYGGGAVRRAVQPLRLRFELLPVDEFKDREGSDISGVGKRKANDSDSDDESGMRSDDNQEQAEELRDFNQPTTVRIDRPKKQKKQKRAPRAGAEIEMTHIIHGDDEHDDDDEDASEASESKHRGASPSPTGAQRLTRDQADKLARGGFEIGDSVVLGGLRTTRFNGRHGKILGWDSDSLRWSVNVREKWPDEGGMLLIKAQNLSKHLTQAEKHQKRLELLANEHARREREAKAAAAAEALDPHSYAYGGDEGAAAGVEGAKLAFVAAAEEASSGKQKPTNPKIRHLTSRAHLSAPDTDGMQQIRDRSSLGTKRVYARRAPNPTNVIWMNMGVSVYSRCGRVFLVYLVSLLILAASFIGCFLAKSYIQGQSFGADVDCSLVSLLNSSKYDAAKQWLLYEDSLAAAEEELDGVNTSSLILPGSPNLLRCYCNNASTGLFASVDNNIESFERELELASVELGIDLDIASTDVFLCEALYLEDVLNLGIGLATILFINVMNFVIRGLLRAFTKFERHITTSQEVSSIFLKVFFALVINSVLIIIIQNANLEYFGIVTWEFVSTISGDDAAFVFGAYNDFQPDWYFDVGVALVLVIIFNTGGTVLVPIWHIVWYRVRLWWDRGFRCCSEDHVLYSRQKTQLGLNALYTGPEFPYAINYANAQMIVFVSFSLSAGMPIMYFVGFISFLLIFVIHKWGFVSVYQTPPRYDHTLSNVSTTILLWSVVVHLLFALWQFTNPDMFAQNYLLTLVEEWSGWDLLSIRVEVQRALDSVGTADSQALQDRLSAALLGFPHLVLLLAVVLIMIMWMFVLVPLITLALQQCCNCRCRWKQIKRLYVLDYFASIPSKTLRAYLADGLVKPSLRNEYSRSLELRAQALDVFRAVFEDNFRDQLHKGWKLSKQRISRDDCARMIKIIFAKSQSLKRRRRIAEAELQRVDETLWRAANLPPEELLEDGHAGDMLAARGSRETLYATLRRNRKRLWRQLDNVAKEEEGLRIRREHAEYRAEMLFRARGSRHVFFRHFVNDIVRHDIQGAVSFDPHYNTFLRQEFGLTLPRALQEFRFSPRCMYASGQRIFATEEECKATWRLSFNLLLDEVNSLVEEENKRMLSPSAGAQHAARAIAVEGGVDSEDDELGSSVDERLEAKQTEAALVAVENLEVAEAVAEVEKAKVTAQTKEQTKISQVSDQELEDFPSCYSDEEPDAKVVGSANAGSGASAVDATQGGPSLETVVTPKGVVQPLALRQQLVNSATTEQGGAHSSGATASAHKSDKYAVSPVARKTQALRTRLQIVDIYFVLHRYLVRKLKRTMLESADSSDLKKKQKKKGKTVTQSVEESMPTARDTTREMWWKTGETGIFDVKAKFQALDFLDRDFLDHQLRALILRIFENVAKKTLAMDVKDVRVTIDEWEEMLSEEVPDATVTDLTSYMRFFYNLSYMNQRV